MSWRRLRGVRRLRTEAVSVICEYLVICTSTSRKRQFLLVEDTPHAHSYYCLIGQ
jgi:hypothetical protein